MKTEAKKSLEFAGNVAFDVFLLAMFAIASVVIVIENVWARLRGERGW